LLIGSFQWMPKQENLRRFIEAAEPLFRARGVELHVVGRMPRKLAAEITRASAVTHLHGFVADVRPHFAQARMAVVPELIGGGFKLKLLDYIFGRVPVAALRCAAAGLPPAIGKSMLCRDDLHELASGICEVIDDTARLNAMQEEAYRHARSCFRWSDSGRMLLWAIRSRAASA
jgi:glycosyltransferase involved in cell wall biosynthesis